MARLLLLGRALEYIKSLVDLGFYGHITIHMQNGKITKMEKYESLDFS